MNVLVIGGGGREHALVWKLRQSPKVDKIFVTPGNAGIGRIAENAVLNVKAHADVVRFVKQHAVDLVVVGPDDSLADGLVDSLSRTGIKTFGPTKAAAEIEWSKAFAKQFMKEGGIPTAKFETFSEFEKARAYLKTQKFPIVIKADGLALGKGVIIAGTLSEAETALRALMVEKIYGAAGDIAVIEEFLEGQEVSIHAFCDGKTAVLFPPAQDHKRIFDGDQGPNTGGMGTIAPVPWVTRWLLDDIEKTILLPTIRGLAKRGREFVGCLYPGLMITKEGPKVLEFNARFGDPETQSYMRLLKTDLADILLACIDGTLSEISIGWEKKSACCIVLASGGYPGPYQKEMSIAGLESAESMDDVVVFHAGTKQLSDQIVTDGGRVLGVTATGAKLESALEKAYEAVNKIHFKGIQFRRDIGKKSLQT